MTHPRHLIPLLLLLAVPGKADAESPVHAGAAYIVDLLGVVDGGRQRGHAAEGRADAWIDVDGTALGMEGVTVHIDAMAIHGPDFSGAKANTYQVLSNVEAGTFAHLNEAWAEWQATPGLAVKAGLIDLNSEFDVTETASLFLNSAHGIGPEFSQSGANGPSIFPRTATAVIVRGQSGRKNLRLGVFDALAGSRAEPLRAALRLPGTTGALLVAEAELPLGKGQVQFGGWHYTNHFDAVTEGGAPAVSQGAYAMVEGPVTHAIAAWLRVGVADQRANPIASYVGLGLTTEQMGWTFGAALARAALSRPARDAAGDDPALRKAETVFEFTAARAVRPYLLLQPDVQYVVHPSWDATVPNAFVAGLRIKLSWPAK
ncbi:carbohydrate porin [Novosphingobium sp.]|uniref:carbohydrate porin n=1 Tax=Novosphingobium sp. TaxID=1874826 RepID=UPI0038B94333